MAGPPTTQPAQCFWKAQQQLWPLDSRGFSDYWGAQYGFGCTVVRIRFSCRRLQSLQRWENCLWMFVICRDHWKEEKHVVPATPCEPVRKFVLCSFTLLKPVHIVDSALGRSFSFHCTIAQSRTSVSGWGRWRKADYSSWFRGHAPKSFELRIGVLVFSTRKRFSGPPTCLFPILQSQSILMWQKQRASNVHRENTCL